MICNIFVLNLFRIHNKKSESSLVTMNSSLNDEEEEECFDREEKKLSSSDECRMMSAADCCDEFDIEVQENGDVLLRERESGDTFYSTVEGEEEEDGGEITPESDLSDPSRRIWIVTTAALPWRTGTSVNPLLRALHLTKGRPAGYVTLVVPWLEDVKQRRKLYGEQNAFETPERQEEWIRDYCRTRANCPEQEPNLRIKWWNGVYLDSFGSIFPLSDICSLIPKEEADVCILEEPEHLNWFRVPEVPLQQQKKRAAALKLSPLRRKGHRSDGGDDDDDDDDRTEGQRDDGIGNDRDVDALGWAHKFRHVVGILHTNYADYIRQYGMGTSLVTAPALNALSALVVRAYCKRVIRLSATLPALVPSKEVTCNVHGVRSEFLTTAEPVEESPPRQTLGGGSGRGGGGAEREETVEEEDYAAVYFIGKLIWAKGFEQLLEMQEQYRHETGEYFAIDVYGGGTDEKAIQKAFFGRNGMSRGASNASLSSAAASPSGSDTEQDKKAADIFGRDASLRSQLSPSKGLMQGFCPRPAIVDGAETDDDDDDDKEGALEILGELTEQTLGTGAETIGASLKLIESAMEVGLGALDKSEDDDDDDDRKEDEERKGGTSTTTKSTQKHKKKHRRKRDKSPFHIAPARTRFQWRKTPIPARFLGVEDHIIVRDIPQHKIFLNMSTSEVLCTTTAEALAMGKFVILPKHRTLFLAGM
jgi:hypothetical protein